MYYEEKCNYLKCNIRGTCKYTMKRNVIILKVILEEPANVLFYRRIQVHSKQSSIKEIVSEAIKKH